MHFHLPKPMHGWRAFVGEVGIIFFGVLVALAFEALVEEIKWQHKVDDARLELRYEVGHNVALLNNRIAQQKCVERRLDELGAIINQASASGRLPPVGSINAPGSYTWPTTVWESQVAAETATHFPARQIGAIGRVYTYINMAHQADDREDEAWLTLNGMVGPGRAIDAGTTSRLIDALVVARDSNRRFTIMRNGMHKILVKGGLGGDFPQTDPKNPPVISGRSAICDPIGKPPPIYGAL